MKKILIVLLLCLFLHVPATHADCVLGTANCDPCAAGDTACTANAQAQIKQGIAQQPTSQPATAQAPSSSGSSFVPLAPIPGLTQGATADQASLARFFNNLYKYLIGFAAVVAVIQIIWAGLEISTQDSVSTHKKGVERIKQAIIGLVLVLSPVLVFTIINPSILNLSVNIPPLDTKTGQTNQTATVPTTTGSGNPCNSLINAGKNCTQVVFTEDYYASPPPTAVCLIPKDTSRGAFYCTRDMTTCGIALSTFGASAVTGGCKQY